MPSIPPPAHRPFLPPSLLLLRESPRAGSCSSCEEVRAPSASPLPRRAPPPAACRPPGPDIIAGPGDGRSRAPPPALTDVPPAHSGAVRAPAGRGRAARPGRLSTLRTWASWSPLGAGLRGCAGPCGWAAEGGGKPSRLSRSRALPAVPGFAGAPGWKRLLPSATAPARGTRVCSCRAGSLAHLEPRDAVRAPRGSHGSLRRES